MSRRAFTLIEVLIVVSLIAVFSVMASINYNSAQKSIEFTTVFLNISEKIREARNLAINSSIDNYSTPAQVPFAYAVNFSKNAGQTTMKSFIDSNSKPNVTTQLYLLDEGSNKDTVTESYEIPSGYIVQLVAGDALDTFSTSNLDNLNIGFQPPYGDAYISAEVKNKLKTFKNAGIELRSISTGSSKWICTNFIGGVIDESLKGCN